MIADKIEANSLFGGGAEMRLHIDDVKSVQAFMGKYVDGKKYVVEIKRKRAGRSLDANAYCWVLCRKIARELGAYTDMEVYQECIRKYGVSDIRPIPESDAEELCRMWDLQGDGNQHSIIGSSKLDGYINVKFYWGSSQYNSKNMAMLIDGIVSDAHELGIETMTPNDIEKMKQMWGGD